MGRDGLDVASSKFRAGLRVARASVACVQYRRRQGAQGAEHGELLAESPPAGPPPQPPRPAVGLRAGQSSLRGKGQTEVWHVDRRMREPLWGSSVCC